MAVDAPAQAFSQLTIGMPSIPMSRKMISPRMECWLEYIPQKVLET